MKNAACAPKVKCDGENARTSGPMALKFGGRRDERIVTARIERDEQDVGAALMKTTRGLARSCKSTSAK